MLERKDLAVCDAHCDTASEMYGKFDLYSGKAHFNLESAKEYKKYFQIFATWADPKTGKDNLQSNFKKVSENLFYEINKHKDCISLIKSADDIENIKTPVCALLSVEGADIIGENLGYIDYLYDNFVRCVTLTWNYTNAVGGAAGDDAGLSGFGKKAVLKLNEKKMIVDLSHSSEKTFFDCVKISKAPVMASHSNAYALCAHKRNLTDEQIKTLISIGGFMGINYYPVFLNESGKAKICDIIRHIEYVLSLGGEDILGLGSDFDGVDCLPEDMSGAGDVYKIAQELLKLNYKEETVKKIMGENFISYVKKVI